MSPITEIVKVKLQPNLTPQAIEAAIHNLIKATLAAPGCTSFHTSLAHEDPSLLYMLINWTAIEAAIHNLIKATLAAPGCTSFHTSLAHEDPSLLYMLINWTAIEAHQEFAKQDFYPALISDAVAASALPGVLPVVFHVDLMPVGLRNGGVVELVQVYFSISDKVSTSVVEEEVWRLRDGLDGVDRFSGEMAWGWVIEESEYMGGASRVLVVVVGWDSVDACERFRVVGKFKDGILEGVPGWKGVEAVCLTPKTW